MTHTSFGLTSEHFADLLLGSKRFEARLAREKFRDVRVGDHWSVREDALHSGVEIEHQHSAVVRITVVNYFPDFRSLIATVGLARLLPRCSSIDDGVQLYRSMYSEQDELRFGTVAFGVELLEVDAAALDRMAPSRRGGERSRGLEL